MARRFADIGYSIFATQGTAKYFAENGLMSTIVNKLGEDDENDIPALVRTGKVQAIVNTVWNKTYGLTKMVQQFVALLLNTVFLLFTALDTADAMIRVLESRGFTTQAI